jgi:DNA-binding GntR family transcriptional regulator
MINPGDLLPIEHRAYHSVKREILAHAYDLGAAGARLPSERDWCDLLVVSRATVRQALHALEMEGQIQRKPGRGWYVSAPALRFYLNKHVPFTYTAVQQGRKPSWQKVAVVREIPPPEFAVEFGIGKNRRVPKIQVLLKLDSVAVGLESSYLNPLRYPDPRVIEHELPISDELQRISGSPLHYARASIKSTSCGEYAAALMEVHAESPALLVTQWVEADDEISIMIYETIWLASAVEFILE